MSHHPNHSTVDSEPSPMPPLDVLSRFLGRSSPFTSYDLVYVYLTRDIPVIACLILMFGLSSESTSDVEQSPHFIFLVVFIGPIVETAIFIFFALLVPNAWLHTAADRGQASRRLMLLSLVIGLIFGALHYGHIATFLSAVWGGVTMSAILFAHWAKNLRDRGIVMCWAIHALHNSLATFLLWATG